MLTNINQHFERLIFITNVNKLNILIILNDKYRAQLWRRTRLYSMSMSSFDLYLQYFYNPDFL